MERVPERDRPKGMLIRALVAVGDHEAAVRVLESLDRDPGSIPPRIARSVKRMLRGAVLSLQRQTLPEAIASFRQVEDFCPYCVHAPIADAFDRLGMADSALAYYEKWAGDGESWDAGAYQTTQPGAYFRMAELYEARGDKARAIDFYGRFTELWREADPQLQPRVAEAKRRIAELRKSIG
jgi:tetratricopeptide (TPR) repeat protein